MLQLSETQQVVVWILPVLFALTLHEAAHAYTAYYLGDTTPKLLNRLSFNPLNHIDPIGTILVPIITLFLSNFSFVFGWAKPVPMNTTYFKNLRRDIALTTAAGPLANLLMAFLWAICLKISTFYSPEDSNLALFMLLSGNAGIIINLMFCFLNLIPIPPLDGSRIVSSLLPHRAIVTYNKLEPYGFLILFVLLFLGVLSWILSPLISSTYTFFKLILNI